MIYFLTHFQGLLIKKGPFDATFSPEPLADQSGSTQNDEAKHYIEKKEKRRTRFGGPLAWPYS